MSLLKLFGNRHGKIELVARKFKENSRIRRCRRGFEESVELHLKVLEYGGQNMVYLIWDSNHLVAITSFCVPQNEWHCSTI
jgi:hypothetical protein